MSYLKALSQWIVATLEPYGAPGLMIIAIFDSSFLSLPEVNDAALMALSIAHPSRMWEYAAMTVLGSVIGCTLLYSVGRKGGEAMLRKRFAADKVDRIRGWYQKYGMLAVIVPSLLPPPLPFKIFVLTAGAFHTPWLRFMAAVAIGRSIRYFAEGILAVWYGKQAIEIVANNFPIVGMVLAGVIVACALVYVFMRRNRASLGLVLLPLLMTLMSSGCVTTEVVPPERRMAAAVPFTREQAIKKLETISGAIETFRAPLARLEGSTALVTREHTRKSGSLGGALLMTRDGKIVLKGTKLTSVFEMKSDGADYQVFVDLRDELYVGREDGPPSKPFSHLDELGNQFVNPRPKQLREALMPDVSSLLKNPSVRVSTLRSPEPRDLRTYLIVQFLEDSSKDPKEARLLQRFWFDLSTNNVDMVRRQTYTPTGDVETDTQYSGHEAIGNLRYPARVDFHIVASDTVIRIDVDPSQVSLNTEIPKEFFELNPHPGAKIYKFEPSDAGAAVNQQR